MQNFDELAKNFDTAYRIERANSIATEIKKNISPQSKTAMEFGCGTGLVGLQLSDQFKYITFVDNSKGMIEVIENKCNLLGIKNAKVICCDIMKEEFAECYDYIFSSMTLHHIIDTEKILSLFYKLIVCGGKLLIVDLDVDDGSFHRNHIGFDGHNGFEHKSLTEMAKKVGFKNVTIQTFYESTKTHDEIEKAYSLFIMKADK